MSWEIDILHFLSGIRTPFLNGVFETITFTAESAILLVVSALVYWCVNKKLGQKLGVIMLFSLITNGLIKNLVKAPRPFDLGIVEPLRKHTATGYSFPSGHTQAATTFWFVWMTHVNKRWLYYIGSMMIVLIAISRLYLGVHWPMDVMAAIAVGVISSSIGQYIFESMDNSKRLKMIAVGCILIWSTLFLRFDDDYVKAVGAVTGFIIGYILERRYIRFSTQGSFQLQIYKALIGLIGLAIVYGGLKLVFPPSLIFSFIRYELVTIWIIAGAPYVFQKLLKGHKL